MSGAVQLQLPLEFAPQPMRAHGLSDAHAQPLVSPDVDRVRRSWRTRPARAWRYPRLELRTGTSYPAILLDCDSEDSIKRLIHARQSGDPSVPNVITFRKGSGHAHAAWFLAAPVHRYAGAARRPLAAFARAAEYLAHALQADPGYRGVLTLNPTWDGPEFDTWWGPTHAYHLAELLEAVPARWRVPAVPRTEAGRNVALFRWAVRESHTPRWGRLIAAAGTKRVPAFVEHVAARNALWFAPVELPAVEVRSIAASACRYSLEQWSDGQLSLIQSRRGEKSGRVRREEGGIVSRDVWKPWKLDDVSRATWYRRRQGGGRADVVAAVEARQPWVEAGVSRRTWYYRQAAGAGAGEAAAPSIEARQPWVEAGVSRRTWYYRQAAGADCTTDCTKFETEP